jgi:N-acetylglucosamine-6-phosphate deacetylase
MRKYAITSKKIFDGEQFLSNKAIIISENKIEDILDLKDIGSIELIDYQDNIIAPAFIDLQLNGCGGVLFNDDISEHTLEVMHKTNLRFGTTSFLPTLITTSEDNIKKAVEVVTKFHEKHPFNVIGIHIEGPYISKIKKGIHNPIYMKPISLEMVEFLVEAGKKVPIKITMAPEENSIDRIKQLVDGGVKVSIGHTNADYKTAKEGIRAGISFATHLFNAMSPMEGRSPNVVGAVLDSHSVHAGIIVDGYHVDYASISLVKEIKKDKLYIVTDAVTPMGTDMEQFQFADQTIYVRDGKCENKDGTLAGANIDMMTSVANAVSHANISLCEALRMASLYPAEAIGKSNIIGRIAKQYVANLTIFDRDYKTVATIDCGNVIKL